MKSTSRWIVPLAIVLAAGLGPIAAAQDDDEEIQQSVARIAYVTGEVSYNRGDDPDAWDAASINFPMTIGDRIWAAGDGRAELQARGANLFLSSQTELAALNLTEGVQQFSLTQGTVSVRLHRLEGDDVFEVDTPNAAVTFETAGSYRIDVDKDGNTRIVVRKGRALLAAGGGQVPVESGDEATVDGIDQPTYDVVAAERMDGWDRWVEERAARYRSVRAADAINADVIGYDELGTYGRWDDVPGYGRAWSPSSVEAGWAPYREGRWMWQDPWGWTWVASEPWGFAPYHYGRWVNHSSRWWWVPGGPRERERYSPALVAFVGGGPGSIAVSGGGYVGWFPLGPADPFMPWWGRHRAFDDRHVTYVNHSYITVVQRNVFISGNVGRNWVHDPAVLRTVGREPILRGPIPILPTHESIRVSIGVPRGIRPPSPIAMRSVVTRLAPPPAPPGFAAKLDVIRENRGAPVAPIAASRLSIERHDGARAAIPIRPVSQEHMVLQPKREGGLTPRPVAVTAPSGKVLSTRERPFVQAPGTVSGRTEHGAPAPAPAPGAAGNRVSPAPAPVRVEGRDERRGPPPVREDHPAPAPVRVDRAAPPVREAPPVRDERAAPPTPAPRERIVPTPREHVAPPPVQERATPAPVEHGRPFERPRERATPVPQEHAAPPAGERAAPPARVEHVAPPPVRVERTAPPVREEHAAPPPRVERAAPAPVRPERVERRDERKQPPPAAPKKDKDEKKDDKKD